jgi:predicted RNase H-like HicB family nuclease
MRYIALVDGKDGAYGVVVPDLPGCTSAGSTTDKALRNAVEAVRLWVEDAIDDGEALPPPRSVEALRADPEVAAALAEGAALAIVPLLLDSGRAVRANLSLDARPARCHRRSGKGTRAHAFGFSRERCAGEDRRARGIARDTYQHSFGAHAARSPNRQPTRLAGVGSAAPS